MRMFFLRWFWVIVVGYWSWAGYVVLWQKDMVSLFTTEYGITENATVLFLFISVVFNVLFLYNVKRHKLFLSFRWLKSWYILFLLGTVYFLGEEASWGMWYFGWEAPEFIKQFNYQQETNLHNTVPVFNMVPKLLLQAFIFVVSVVWPLYFCNKGIERFEKDDWKYWFFPDRIAITAAVLLLFFRVFMFVVYLGFYFCELRGYNLWYNGVSVSFDACYFVIDEMLELCIAFWMLSYTASIYNRVKNLSSGDKG